MPDFVNVAKVTDFRAGKIRRYFLQGKEIGVVNMDGDWYAFSNLCTHRQFQLHFAFADNDRIYCPIHYAEFDIRTGEVLAGPRYIDPLPCYQVRIDGDDVQVSLEPPVGS
jgi:3-phenylpropionate/trans-cinnamate dioxygenase ferredoxin subunit